MVLKSFNNYEIAEKMWLWMGLLVSLLVANVSALGINETHRESVVDTYGQIPLHFEANQGQADSHVRFLSRGKGYTLFLTPGEAVLNLRVPVESEARSEEPVTRLRDPKGSLVFQTVPVHLQLMGANQRPKVAGLEEQFAKVDSFVGAGHGRPNPTSTSF
jgi:hypothetical protein